MAAKAKPAIDLKGTENFDYDAWLEFFSRIRGAGGVITDNIDYIKYNADGYGYAAAMRWLEIFSEPSRMDKLYKGRLEKDQTEDIMEIAIGDNDEAFYEALIRKNVIQLNSSSASQQEVARLSQNINIFRKALKEIRSRKPKEGSVLDKVLKAAEQGPVKKPRAISKKAVKPKVKAVSKPKAVKKTKDKK
jgi:hypothetical protein